MSRNSDLYCPHCGSPQLRSASKKRCADLLGCSTDFIQDHIDNGTINTIALKSPNPEAKRKLIRIRIVELLKIIEERPGMETRVENALKDW